MLTKEFASISDHGTPFDEENDPMSVNLFNMPGVRWKNMRAKLSPVFTSGKLKQMLPLMLEVSDELARVLSHHAKRGETVKLKNYLVRYATDVIGSCAFGISCNSLQNSKSEFYVKSQKFSQPSLLLTTRFVIMKNKFVAKLIPFKRLFPDVHEFFISLMAKTINYRKTNNIERNDLVQQMMEVQKKDEGKTKESHPDEVIFTDVVIAAQAFLFFAAGLDGIANTVGFALHPLSLNPQLQDDLADEILSVINQHDGEITYQGLKEMKLLEMVVSEALRMYSPAAMLFREVTTASYTIPDIDITLQRGQNVVIPMFGLHYDPDIYPDPERFDPYRFSDENMSKRHQYAYLPFGEGPRICIANRMALLQIKLTLAAIIKDFKFSVSPKTEVLSRTDKSTTPCNHLNTRVEVVAGGGGFICP